MIPMCFYLIINYASAYCFICYFPYVVHLLYPLHLVGAFELFSDTFLDGEVGGEAVE